MRDMTRTVLDWLGCGGIVAVRNVRQAYTVGNVEKGF